MVSWDKVLGYLLNTILYFKMSVVEGTWLQGIMVDARMSPQVAVQGGSIALVSACSLKLSVALSKQLFPRVAHIQWSQVDCLASLARCSEEPCSRAPCGVGRSVVGPASPISASALCCCPALFTAIDPHMRTVSASVCSCATPSLTLAISWVNRCLFWRLDGVAQSTENYPSE